MKFFKAGEANERITELEQKVVQLETAAKTHAEQLSARDSQITTLTTERDQARTDLAARDITITQLNGTVTTLTTERDQARGQVTKLEGEAKDAEARAQQILGSMGITTAVKKETADDSTAGAGKTEEQLWTEYNQIKTSEEKRAFYLKHAAVLGK